MKRSLERDEKIRKCRKLEDGAITLDKLKNNKAIKITLLEYKMLNSNTFINDSLIEYYLNYWYSNYLYEEEKQKTAIFNTHFYKRLTNPIKLISGTSSEIRHKRVQSWTKNINIFKKDYIFIPIHDYNHWYLAVICFPNLTGKVNMEDGLPLHIPDNQPDSKYRHQKLGSEYLNPNIDEADPNQENLWFFDLKTTQNTSVKIGSEYYADVGKLRQNQTLIKQPCIIILDSLTGGYHRARVVATLREWMYEEYRSKNQGQIRDLSSNVVKGGLVKVPQQPPNNVDCGLFVMHFFQRFFERPIIDFNFPINHLENWFPVDEVSKNCQKRAEVKEIILTEMAAKRIKLPSGVELPMLDFGESNASTHSQLQSNLAVDSTFEPMLSQFIPKQQIIRLVENKNQSSQYYIDKEEEPQESNDHYDIGYDHAEYKDKNSFQNDEEDPQESDESIDEEEKEVPEKSDESIDDEDLEKSDESIDNDWEKDSTIKPMSSQNIPRRIIIKFIWNSSSSQYYIEKENDPQEPNDYIEYKHEESLQNDEEDPQKSDESIDEEEEDDLEKSDESIDENLIFYSN